jgi:hypothetical protein
VRGKLNRPIRADVYEGLLSSQRRTRDVNITRDEVTERRIPSFMTMLDVYAAGRWKSTDVRRAVTRTLELIGCPHQ